MPDPRIRAGANRKSDCCEQNAGAIIGTLVTRARFTFRGEDYRTPLEVRVPSAQRNWVGIGCAAGVAAAFNAPCGGILYSFEEVCSHWSAQLTWRSFKCAVVMSLTYAFCVDISDGELTAGYDIAHKDDAQ